MNIRVLNVGESAVSTNEKYLRLKCDELCDACLTRSAIRNLRLVVHGHDPEVDLQRVWRGPIASIPEGVVEWFANEDQQHKFTQETRPLSY